MTPTPDQLSAAREWLNARADKDRDEMETVRGQMSTHDVARFIAAREASAYESGWRHCYQVAADNGAMPRVLAAIRALEPPSGEGE